MKKTFKKIPPSEFLKKFGDEFEIINGDNYFIGVFPNKYDDFRHFSVVNGIIPIKGGSHIDYLIREITEVFKTKLQKKYPNIKYGDIKNKLFIVVVANEVENLDFDGQTKADIRNHESEMKAYFKVNWVKESPKLLKSSFLVDPIVEIFKLKEAARLQKELQDIDKKKPKVIEHDKYLAPIGKPTNIMLCEGDSAASGLAAILGRKDTAYFAMFGVPPNSYKMELKKLIKSPKIKSLIDIIGISLSSKDLQTCNFTNIIIATDADLYGFNIRGQLIGLFYRFAPNLFHEGRIKVLQTPLIIAKDKRGNIKRWFYNFNDYNAEKAKLSQYTLEYKKGLGSLEKEELDFIIEKDGLDNMLETLEINDTCQDEIERWLGIDVQPRKESLRFSTFNIMNS